MATLSDDPREAVAQAQKDARALEAAKMFQASQDRRSIQGLGYLLPVDFPTKESGAVDFSGARPAVPQIIKDVANFVTQTGAGAMGKAPPMAPEDLAMGMLDFTGAGILASTPARMAAKQTGDTILGTAGGEGAVQLVTTAEKKSPFGLNPPVINQFEGDYLDRPKPSIGKLAQDYSPVYNSLLDPKTLGFSPSVSKKSLTGEQIIARLKNQESVTKDELAYLDLENSLVKKDKYSLEDVKAIVRASEPQIHIKSSSLDDMNPDFEVTYYDEQRIIPQGQERDYREYVFQDQSPSLPSVKDMERAPDEVELEVLQRIDDRIIEKSAQPKFSHYTDFENVIGHARVAKIDSPFDARDNAIVIEEIQSDLIAASNPKTNRMNDGEEYATPEKVGQALKEAQDFYKENPKIKELEQEIINTRRELDQANADIQAGEMRGLDRVDPLTEKLASLKDELSNSLDNFTNDELEGAGFVTGAIKTDLIQNPPFSTNKAAARYFMQNVIKDAVRGGTKTILLPDYEDLAKFHGKEDVKGFKLNYTDVFDKLISDYKKQGMRLKTGTVDISDDFSRKLRPMKYVTFLNPFDDIDRSLIRRYSKGGKVDIKGGIGAMAPTHM